MSACVSLKAGAFSAPVEFESDAPVCRDVQRFRLTNNQQQQEKLL